MSKRAAFTFTILRYMHDITTGEFVNVGVVLHCSDLTFVGGRFGVPFHRLKATYPHLNEWAMQPAVEQISTSIKLAQVDLERHAQQVRVSTETLNVMTYARAALPVDDSSLQWAPPGSGITVNPSKSLDDLFHRYVGRHSEGLGTARPDEEVWATFLTQMRRKQIDQYLSAQTVTSGDFSFEFLSGWRNSKIHAYLPISLDLPSPALVEEKAFSLLGRLQVLNGITEDVRLFVLFGSALSESGRDAASRAVAILEHAPFDVEAVPEGNAETFADRERIEIQMWHRRAGRSGSQA